MGKSWKEKPDKWRKNRDFQKKQQKKHGNKHQNPMPVKDWTETDVPDNEIGGLNDYAYGM